MKLSLRTRTQAYIAVSWMSMIRRVVCQEAASLGIDCPRHIPRRVLLGTITNARAFARQDNHRHVHG